MSRLDRLIDELCPNGVEYVPIKSIAEVATGSSDRKNAIDDGEYPFMCDRKIYFVVIDIYLMKKQL